MLIKTIPHPEGLLQLNCRLSKSEFITLAPGLESLIFNSQDPLISTLVGTLLSLFELKKLDANFKNDETLLDKSIVQVYTYLLLSVTSSRVSMEGDLDFLTVFKRALTACRSNMTGKRLNLYT
jgi:hypothetical protein